MCDMYYDLNTDDYQALYCTALHCTVLHCTVLHCTVLYCTALHCTALYYTCIALHYIALYYTCIILYYTCIALHCTALHCTVLCYTVLYSIVSYFIVSHFIICNFNSLIVSIILMLRSLFSTHLSSLLSYFDTNSPHTFPSHSHHIPSVCCTGCEGYNSDSQRSPAVLPFPRDQYTGLTHSAVCAVCGVWEGREV